MVIIRAQVTGTHKPCSCSCPKMWIAFILFDLIRKSGPPPKFRTQETSFRIYKHTWQLRHASDMHDQRYRIRVSRYEEPLGIDRIAAEQPEERARLCHRLESMWQGMQQDIETQRNDTERGVDPRWLQLQVQVIKLQATLWKMTGTPVPEPPPAIDPAAEHHDAVAEVQESLDRIRGRIDEA